MSDFAIGDISGCKKEFDLLVAHPWIKRIIAMGDIIDRGPESRQMIEFFINNPQHICLMGNHEHMFIKIYEFFTQKKPCLYIPVFWIYVNGGKQTLESYGIEVPDIPYSRKELTKEMNQTQLMELTYCEQMKKVASQFDKIPKEHINFLKTLPFVFETDSAIYTHAPINNWKNKKFFQYDEMDKDKFAFDNGALWNRNDPKRPAHPKFQVYGHQNRDHVLAHTKKHPKGVYVKTNQLPTDSWAVCVDTIKAGYLTGLKMDDLTIHHQVLIK